MRRTILKSGDGDPLLNPELRVPSNPANGHHRTDGGDGGDGGVVGAGSAPGASCRSQDDNARHDQQEESPSCTEVMAVTWIRKST